MRRGGGSAIFARLAPCLLASAAIASEPGSVRQRLPLTISVAVNAAMPSAGVDLSWQLADRWAVGVQATTLVVHYDVSARTRLLIVAGERHGLYLGANAHWWYSPLILAAPTGAATAELGYEFRNEAGFTLGLGVGGGVIAVPAESSGASAHREFLPLLNLRVGRSM